MAEHGIQEKLVDYLKDAHAMETNASQMLDSMIATTDDEATRRELEHHREETERHRELLADRLRAHGADVSMVKESKALGSAIVKAFTDMAGGDQPGKVARDGFIAEQVEIASYELLERLARRAGDEATAEVAKRNRADEQAMADKIASNWDRFLELSLKKESIAV